MSNDLEIVNDMLHLHLRPWKSAYSEQKFRELLHLLEKENYHRQPLYEVAFPKALTAKTKFYRGVIHNEVAAFLNEMDSWLTAASGENEKKYYIFTALTKRLKVKLEDTEKEIARHHLYFKTIEDHHQDKNVRENAWIIQYLKYQLIRLYLEIQDRHPEYLPDDQLTEEDIHSLYFSENTLSGKFIKKLDRPFLPEFENETLKNKAIKFTPLKADTRGALNEKLTYSKLIADPGKFATIEIKLFNEALIDCRYQFIKKQGHKMQLAAVYHILIKNKCFNELHFPGKARITNREYRQFLNHRYNATIDKEFRNFNNAELLEAYIDKHPWIGLVHKVRNI